MKLYLQSITKLKMDLVPKFLQILWDEGIIYYFFIRIYNIIFSTGGPRLNLIRKQNLKIDFLFQNHPT